MYLTLDSLLLGPGVRDLVSAEEVDAANAMTQAVEAYMAKDFAGTRALLGSAAMAKQTAEDRAVQVIEAALDRVTSQPIDHFQPWLDQLVK